MSQGPVGTVVLPVKKLSEPAPVLVTPTLPLTGESMNTLPEVTSMVGPLSASVPSVVFCTLQFPPVKCRLLAVIAPPELMSPTWMLPPVLPKLASSLPLLGQATYVDPPGVVLQRVLARSHTP